MKKTVGKGILFYLFVLFSIAFGVLCIFAGILIFSPGAEIFGISYSYSKAETFYQKIAVEDKTENISQLIKEGKITKFVIDSDNFNIYINRENVVNVGLRVKNEYSGLSKHDQRKVAKTTIDFDKDAKTIQLQCVEKVLSTDDAVARNVS